MVLERQWKQDDIHELSLIPDPGILKTRLLDIDNDLYYNTLKRKGLNQMLKIVGHNNDEFMTLYGI